MRSKTSFVKGVCGKEIQIVVFMDAILKKGTKDLYDEYLLRKNSQQKCCTLADDYTFKTV